MWLHEKQGGKKNIREWNHPATIGFTPNSHCQIIIYTLPSKIEAWPACAWQTRLNSNWDESTTCITGPWIAFPIRNSFILIITYAQFGFSQVLGQEKRSAFLFFCTETGKWGQSVWGLFFWISKELTVNSTQELPSQAWVLAAGCTGGASLEIKSSIKQLTHILYEIGKKE